MSITELAAILAAVAFCVLVALLLFPIVRVNKILKVGQHLAEDLNKSLPQTVLELRELMNKANESIDRFSEVTEDAGKVASHAAAVSEDAAQFSELLSAVVRKPMIKTAAFTYGVRKAIGSKK